jgi:hypothetical protein
LRVGDAGASAVSARAFDTDYSFMLFEISGDELFYQAISRTGHSVDSGSISLRDTNPATSQPVKGGHDRTNR